MAAPQTKNPNTHLHNFAMNNSNNNVEAFSVARYNYNSIQLL